MKLITALIISLSLVFLMPVSAQAWSPFDDGIIEEIRKNSTGVVQNNYRVDTDETSLFVIVAQIIQVFLGLLGTIFIMLMIYAGYSWMTAAGEDKKVQTAQDTIRVAIIGILLIFAAYIITYFVFKAIPSGEVAADIVSWLGQYWI